MYLDKGKLLSSNETSQIDAIYIKNQNKQSMENSFKKDGIVYKFVQMKITYVDYFDQSNIGNIEEYADKNKIIIDPLFPNLPTKVHAYASLTENNIIKDVGLVDVTYSAEFYENNYEGGEGQYQITLTDSLGYTNILVISVLYQNRKVDKMFVIDAFYGGGKVTSADMENSFFMGYYNLYNEIADTNILLINPINDAILDTYNKKYILPTTLGVRFSNGETAVYTNVVWDLSQINYTLVGQNNISLRILSYDIEDAINNVITSVVFTYSGGGSVRISTMDADRVVISSKVYENAPSFAIWNVLFQSNNQSISSVNYYVDDTFVNLGVMVNNSYVNVPASTKILNPYDLIFPKTVAVNFGDGTTIELNPNWRLEPGPEGTYKLKDILLGTAQDRMVIAVFTYLGYNIRFRFETEDIEIESVDTASGEYIDGGVLYLVAGAGSAYVQLQKNYAYMHYNFSKTINVENWQKVPLSFMDVELSRIVTSSPRIYNGIMGVLGWDKLNFPDINFSPNIQFTVIIIEPKLYSYLDTNTLNSYVVNDYFSTPYDNNYQKKKDVNEPNTIGDYFVQLAGIHEELDTYFTIIPTQTIYKIVDEKVNFKVSYEMSSSNTRLAFLAGGVRTISFEISIKLTPYLYTSISNLEFLHQKTAEQTLYWTWTTVSPNASNYVDAIHWPLGTTLKSSELPKAKDAITGAIISLMWDLNDVNINLATSEGYKVKGWYYDSSSSWKYLELTIFVDKTDKKANVLSNLGGNYALISLYSGRYYKLPIRPNENTLKFLRSDGTYEYLNINSYVIEYKLSSENSAAFSATNYPINAGVYDIRVTIDDYNVFIKGELIFTLTIRPITIDSSGIVFAGDEQSATNTITYTYDAQNHPLVVTEGLPKVVVDNYFASLNEKEAMINKYRAQGYTETAAKTRAYNDLYGRVTIATRRYLDAEIARIRRESGITDVALLNATLFDRLEPNMMICEVVYTITYRNSNDEVLANPPIDVGSYTVLFEVTASNNTGNYTFSTERISRRIVIVKPDAAYSILSDTIVYNGRNQNPLINNLHDASGVLPGGVQVTYNYRYTENGITKYATNGIVNVGSYYCDIAIDGGNNYPSMNIATSTVYIAAKEMRIDLSNISMQYLSNLANLEEYVTFSGLAGTDKAREFGKVITETQVKSYYTLGIYEAYVRGFKLNADSTDMYTSYDLSTTYTFNEKSYYKLSLKNANLPGSLYQEIDSDGNYIYGDLINKFRNYAIYIITAGEYEICAEEDAVVIESDEALQMAIAGITENQSIKLYLTPGEYSAFTLNINADVSIIGCYDYDKNILTKIKGITVNAGVLTLKIIKFEAQNAGGVSLLINNNANSIGIYDCEFNGLKRQYAVAIKTGINYKDKIYMVASKVYDYHRGVELVNGNLELTQTQFRDNKFGITIQSKQTDLRITQSEFSNHDIAILSSNEKATVLYNTFDCNRVAVRIPESDFHAEITANNTFSNTNGTDLDHNV